VIDFPSLDEETIFDLGWRSNNDQKCFQVLQDKDAQGNSFSYLRAEGGLWSPTSSSSTPSLPRSGNSANLGESYWNGMNTGWYPSYPYYLGFAPPIMPFSPMGLFSPFGLGIGGPFGMGFGMGYGLAGSPLLAMGILGSPLTLGLSSLYGGGLYGLGVPGLYGLGSGGLGSGLSAGLSGILSPLFGTSTGDTFYNKLFSLLFEGAVPVSTASIVLPVTNPPSTVLPPTAPVPAVVIAPVVPASTTGGMGGGGSIGGIGGGGYTGGGGGGGGGGGVIP
jgi:hypothetical protein